MVNSYIPGLSGERNARVLSLCGPRVSPRREELRGAVERDLCPLSLPTTCHWSFATRHLPQESAHFCPIVIDTPELETSQLIENKRRRFPLIANKHVVLPNRMKAYRNAHSASRWFVSGLRIVRPDSFCRDCAFCIPMVCIGTVYSASRCLVSGVVHWRNFYV